MQYYTEHEYDCLGNYDPIIPPCKVCDKPATRSINWLINPKKDLKRKFEYYCDKHAPKEAAKF